MTGRMQTSEWRTRTSYGIALCRTKNNISEIIMVKKRLSYYFCQFVMGKYRKGNNSDLMNLFNNMTLQEKMDIMSLDFYMLWSKIWNTSPIDLKKKKFANNQFYTNFIKGKNKFEYLIAENNGKKLKSMINRSSNASVIWEIPKGKQMNQETELEAAMREFHEETGISSEFYDILWNEPPMSEIFVDRGNTYHNKYFLAKVKNNAKQWCPQIYFNIKERFDEIEFAKWVSVNELMYLHINNKAKKRLLKFVRAMFKKIR